MNTKTIIYVLVIVAIAFGAFYFFSLSQNVPAPTSQEQAQPAQTTSANTTAVSIVNFSFNPATITVNKGDTVVWTNNDSVNHQIAGDGGLGGPVMNKGQTYSFTFNTAGTFNYHCAIHPSMKGIVVVQ